MLVVAAPDKFRGTSSAAGVATAVATGVRAAGGVCDQAPVADGGEGTLEALGGSVRVTTVGGPLGDPVAAEWRMQADGTAVVASRSPGSSFAAQPSACAWCVCWRNCLVPVSSNNSAARTRSGAFSRRLIV